MGIESKKKDKWKGENRKINWDKVEAIHITYPPGSLEQDWKEEALRHREEIKRLKEEYVMLQNASDEVEGKLREDIERLERLWETDKESWNELMAEKEREIDSLYHKIGKIEQENAVLKTQVVNKDRYTYGIR